MEQASERRALDEPELSPSELVDLLPEPRKHHKKPAISISQFGKVIVLSSRFVCFLTPTSEKSEKTMGIHQRHHLCLPQHPSRRSTIP